MGAIPTLYGGINYRSRLEAKWAVFLGLIGWEIIYEPLDGVGYIPDFMVVGHKPFFIEVKPALHVDEFTKEMQKVRQGLDQNKNEVLIVGLTPFNSAINGFAGYYGNDVCAGLMLSKNEDAEFWNTANWRQCLKCHQFTIVHTWGDFTTNPCGHKENKCFKGQADISYLSKCWNYASNEVQLNGYNL